MPMAVMALSRIVTSLHEVGLVGKGDEIPWVIQGTPFSAQILQLKYGFRRPLSFWQIGTRREACALL